eukprot:7185640-Prymnesium_polylepis.2
MPVEDDAQPTLSGLGRAVLDDHLLPHAVRAIGRTHRQTAGRDAFRVVEHLQRAVGRRQEEDTQPGAASSLRERCIGPRAGQCREVTVAEADAVPVGVEEQLELGANRLEKG